MLTGSTVLKRAMVAAALALPIVSAPLPALAAAAGTGATCTSEDWVWAGTASLDASTAEFDTGLIVPVTIGATLTVTGVSADGLDSTGHARALTVLVGGTPATPGSPVPGGRVVVAGDGAPAQLTGVTVVLDRCADVQSAAPEQPAAAPDLPGTGARSEVTTSLVGVAAIAAGTAMIVVGRRRPVA
jgi:hypothetical protein